MIDTLRQLAVSERGMNLPASPIRRLVPFQEQAKARGIKVYHLNIGQPDIPTPPQFFEAIQRANIKVLDYTHSAGYHSYREKLAGYYGKFTANLSPEHILVTTSGSEALRFAFMTCLDPGDEVIVIEPCYANYMSFAVEAGVRLVAVTSFVEDDFALPPISEIKARISDKTKAILLCNPSNPTGKLYAPEELAELSKIIKEYNLFLISDEVYAEFVYDGMKFQSAMALEGLEEHVIIADSISKRYSACGARIGTFISRNAQVLATAMKFAQARLSPPTLGQIGAEALTDLPESYYDTVRAEYKKRRDFVIESLRKMDGVTCPNVSGAFYVMPRLPIDDADNFCRWLLESFDYQGSTVMLAPATGFYVSPNAGKNEVRIAYVLETEALQKAMQCLEEALKVYPNRTN